MSKTRAPARRKLAAIAAASLMGFVGVTAGESGSDGLIFVDGFGEETHAAGGEPAVCMPEAPLYPPFENQGGPTELTDLWAPDAIGSALVQVRVAGDMWEAYAFSRADLPSDLVEFNADTSNVGDRAVGADLRYVVVSACAGDFRPPAERACAALVGEGSFLYVNFGAPVANACNLDPARRYHFNVLVGAAPCNSARNSNNCAFRIMVLPRG